MTTHIGAEKGEIAKIVLMPGDPLRAKYIAETFLQDVKLVSEVRNILVYTGTYKGKTISVMASGMGIPSMGIYAYELYNFFDVEVIIRIGSCGSYVENIHILETVLVMKSYTESNFAYSFNNEKCNLSESDEEIDNILDSTAEKYQIKLKKANVFCADCFDPYLPNMGSVMDRLPKELNCEVADMESFVLFYLAKLYNKKAACLLTVVDSPKEEEHLSAEKRERALDDMIKVALEATQEINVY